MESYVVRIYRSEKDKPRILVGVVEEVGADGKKAFTNLDELWEILNPKKKAGARIQKEFITPKKQDEFKKLGRAGTSQSILSGKRILAVDDEPDVLAVLEEEIRETCPTCVVDRATNYEMAEKMITQFDYDAVILDIMGVRGFDLLKIAVGRNNRVAMLTAHSLSAEALKQSWEMGARAYLPKEKLGDVVPFLEDILKYEYLPGWSRLIEKLKGFFDQRFESEWDKKVSLNWQQWDRHT